jgi:hypothetical protein
MSTVGAPVDVPAFLAGAVDLSKTLYVSLLFSNNQIAHFGDDGIDSGASNLAITKNQIHDNLDIGDGNHEDAMQGANGVVQYNSKPGPYANGNLIDSGGPTSEFVNFNPKTRAGLHARRRRSRRVEARPASAIAKAVDRDRRRAGATGHRLSEP